MPEVQSKLSTEINFSEVKLFIWSYIKIIGFSFIFPVWVATFFNEGIALWKIISWAQSDIMFWKIKPYFTFTLIVFFIPLVYLVWFYYLTIRKVLRKAHKEFFSAWTKELSNYIAQLTIQQYAVNQEGKRKIDLNRVYMWMNKKISLLPKWLQWVTKRLFDQLPLLELVNAYHFKDLIEGNEEKIASDINKKIEEVQLSIIDSIVPRWTLFIIPFNIILLIFYISF